jgi:hypothetical protein
MNYKNGAKIELLDPVKIESGKMGVVVGFDKVNERDFVEIRLKDHNIGKLWASTNAVTKLI